MYQLYLIHKKVLMPNELRFEVEFTKDQIASLLDDPALTTIVFSGTYTYNPTSLGDIWKMETKVEGLDKAGNKTTKDYYGGCPHPCYSKGNNEVTQES